MDLIRLSKYMDLIRLATYMDLIRLSTYMDLIRLPVCVFSPHARPTVRLSICPFVIRTLRSSITQIMWIQ